MILQTIPNLRFYFSGHALVIVILALLMLGFSLFIYKRTNPIISAPLKSLLVLLRYFALLLIIFMIYEMIIELKYSRTQKPVLAIALDNSASLSIEDKEGSRKEQIYRILASENMHSLGENFDLVYYAFDMKTHRISLNDSTLLQFHGDATDISSALETITSDITDTPLAGIVLVTDGNYNVGGNPIRFAGESRLPIFPVGIGSLQRAADLAIADLTANPLAFVNEPTPITITVRNAGYGESRVQLQLEEHNKILATEFVNMPAAPSEKQVTMKYQPPKPGSHRLTIRLVGKEDELTLENNKKILYIDVLKAKLNISIIAGKVSPDLSFLRRDMSSGERYEVTLFYETKDGALFPRQLERDVATIMDETDIFIFFYFPTRNTHWELLQHIRERIEKASRPVILYVDASVDLNKLADFNEVLPMQTREMAFKEENSYIALSPAGKIHPILQINDSNHTAQNVWAKLPPIISTTSRVSFWPNSEVLATASSSSESSVNPSQSSAKPLIAVRSYGKIKSAVLFAKEMWRWDLMMTRFGENNNVYGQLLNNVARWVEASANIKRVRLHLEKQTFHIGEEVPFYVDVFDQDYHPANDATVALTIRDEKSVHDVLGQKVADGKYSALYHPESTGDHILTAQASVDNSIVGSDTLLFTVGEYSTELTSTELQQTFLKSLAEASGGSYVSPDSLEVVAKKLQPQPIQKNFIQQFALWNNSHILIIIILLLSAEWFIRKKKGMV
jgi:hypothetical protein